MTVGRRLRADGAEARDADGGAAARVRVLPFGGDEPRLLEGVAASHPAAIAALYDRYSPHVTRVLVRILGDQRDVEDLRQDVFVRVLRAARRMRKPEALKAWITRIAVNAARSCLRSRMRRRWLRLWREEERPPEPPACVASPEVAEAVSCTYALLDTLPVDERVVFALRYVEGMELTEVARASGASLATIKRRLARAQRRFAEGARSHPALQPWLEGGTRWSATED